MPRSFTIAPARDGRWRGEKGIWNSYTPIVALLAVYMLQDWQRFGSR